MSQYVFTQLTAGNNGSDDLPSGGSGGGPVVICTQPFSPLGPLHQIFLFLPVAVFLGSAGLYAWSALKRRNGRVKLTGKEGDDRSRLDTEDVDAEEKPLDPFDVTDQELYIDGYPIDETGFWRRTTWKKIAILLLLLPPTVVDLFTLGYLLSIRRNLFSSLPHPLITYLIEHSAALSPVLIYSCVLTLLWLTQQNDVSRHWSTTRHLALVLAVAWFCLASAVVVPSQWDLFSTAPSHLDESIKQSLRTIQVLQASQALLIIPALVLTLAIPRGPPLHFPLEKFLPAKSIQQMKDKLAEKQQEADPTTTTGTSGVDEALLAGSSALSTTSANVTTEAENSVFGAFLYSYATPVIRKAQRLLSLDVWDLPIVTHDMRAMVLHRRMKDVYGQTQKTRKSARKNKDRWLDRLPEGWSLLAKVFYVNRMPFAAQLSLAAVTAVLYYLPAFFLKQLVSYLEDHPDRSEMRWGWLWAFSLFASNALMYLLINQLWSISSTTLQTRIKLQLSMILFGKTLVKKDLAGSARDEEKEKGKDQTEAEDNKAKDGESSKEDEDVSSKSQIITLFTVDTDRVADFVFHVFTLVDGPIEIVFASWFLYKLLGVSALWGLLACIVSMPLNHFASKVVVTTQDSLMNARDERTALMNEVLGGIRMLKFMAWERSFEKRINGIRAKELKALRKNYIIETFFTFVWSLTPILVTLVAFLHYVLIAKKPLVPSIAFTSVSVFNELQFALSALPETFIQVLQGFVSLRRIEKYMSMAEVRTAELDESGIVALNGATITWPRDVAPVTAAPSSVATPISSFTLADLNLSFPNGQMSLICGKLGSGKTLLLLGLLGEADVLTGQVICPRSPPNALEDYGAKVAEKDWVKAGLTAYAAQQAWLQNASIKENIVFGAPFDAERYAKVLEACSLVSDLSIMDDGDETEVGEKGLNLSGGQKARISLARAAYSRASTLLLDDVLSAVDAHTSSFILKRLFQGPLMNGRTVILVSHHIQLVSPAASYIVALDNGDVTYAGDRAGFIAGGFMQEIDDEPKLESSTASTSETAASTPPTEKEDESDVSEETTAAATRKPRKLVEDEQRSTGRIALRVWKAYIKSQGGWWYWVVFVIVLLVRASGPVWTNGWLDKWSSSYSDPDNTRSPVWYVLIYAVLTVSAAAASTLYMGVAYFGSLKASKAIHERMLERVLRATVRFHDTSVRGRVLNRFGKDLEGMDSSAADNWSRTISYALNIVVTFGSITYVGGWKFAVASLALGSIYFYAGSIYGHASRDLRRLDSVNRSPLYALYSEIISGVQTVRAYGASTKLLKLMMNLGDANTQSFTWFWTLNRWISCRFNLLSSVVLGVTAVAVLIAPVSAGQAGFALTFAASVSNDLLFVARRFVSLEQSMVAMERILEYSELPIEGPEFIEPRPPAAWPHAGVVEVKDLEIRYAPDLPAVLHGISFKVQPAEKVGCVGATGSGKSTLALSLFRFVAPTKGQIVIDGLDITDLGLTDLRSRVTIIPQDPTILSGTLRSTLDVFDEYDDAQIYESLRRVHLLQEGVAEGRNANVFKNLDSVVAEGGDNFSQGEKQLICMARAILRRNKVIVMDEATASIDYEHDELISKTIREEFADSTIITIAHRLATIIDYDKVLVMDQGKIAEYASPAELLRDEISKFYALCKATGSTEFKNLQAAAFEAEKKRAGRARGAQRFS